MNSSSPMRPDTATVCSPKYSDRIGAIALSDMSDEKLWRVKLSQRILIAIAGGTCAGKSALAHLLSQQLDLQVSVVCQDDFYPDRSSWHYRDLKNFNWDALTSFDIDQLISCVRNLASEKSVRVPIYDRATHARQPKQSRNFTATQITILEGLHAIEVAHRALKDHARRDLALISVFVDCNESERKIRRERREELMDSFPGSFSEFWVSRCEPTFRQEVLPQRSHADIILRSPWSPAALCTLFVKIYGLTK